MLEEAGSTQVTLTAEVELSGQRLNISGAGTGPIDAFVEGLSRVTGEAVRVLDYHEHAVGAGAHVQAVAYLELRVGQQTVFGVGRDANIVSASLKAIVSGYQRAQAIKHKTSQTTNIHPHTKEPACQTN